MSDAITTPIPAALPAVKAPRRSRKAAAPPVLDETRLVPVPDGYSTFSGLFVGEGDARKLDDTPVPIYHLGFCSTIPAFLAFALEQVKGADGLSFFMDADETNGVHLLWAKASPFTDGKVPFCVSVSDCGVGFGVQAAMVLAIEKRSQPKAKTDASR